ncbi:hypothetical protein C2845_PM05G26000 [Panicum miliaceum]|uniref:Myb/SANT-like domain-containing protein n=1 Tax=Panicum miliaceum TaxID=4540 RepID=A0A3L6T3E0_PANMI|nr:hypothetical protein C2845_PM05G26000 [Panicum miliaceum]
MPSPRFLPQIPQFTGCLAAAAGRIARPPRRRSRRQPHHSASRFLLRFCIATQEPEQPAYASLPHLSPAAPWELAISWISGRPVPGTMSGGQEDTEGSDHNMDMQEGNTTTRIKRAKATNWPRVMSKFLLDWYLEKKRGMPPKTKFKKMHHVWCTSAVNSKFRTNYSVDQVHRHFRRFKEIWIIVTRYANVTGSRFNSKHKMLILPAATMASLPIAERAILAKPIPFFDHLLQLFNEGQLDAACMRDPIMDDDSHEELEAQIALNIIAQGADKRDQDGVNLDIIELEGEDNHHEVAASSDGVPCEVMSDTSAPSAQPSGSFAESTMAALKPSTKKMKIISKTKPSPKPQALVPHDGRNIDVLNSTLVGIHDSAPKLVRAAPTSTSDPNAPLWNMLKEIPLTHPDRLSIGMYLCKPESEVHRSFFMNMGKEYLESWARKFLAGEEPGAL